MFFHPLRLGSPPARRSPGSEDADEDRTHTTYEAWRESVSAPLEVGQEFSEHHVFNELFTSTLWGSRLILGEPGVGKTTLLEEWHSRWIGRLSQPRLGLRVPVLVRLRDVDADDWRKPDSMADQLWRRGLNRAQALTKHKPASEIFVLSPRLFAPVWLLDGVDEAQAAIGDAAFWEGLAALPGDVVATCRIAVFETVKQAAGAFMPRPLTILGLRPHEQPAFLAKALEEKGLDPGPAATLIGQLNANAALRHLATVPMILDLLAESGGSFDLPHNRAGFYERATNAMWSRRLRADSRLYDLAEPRDVALASVAGEIGPGIGEIRHDTLQRYAITGDLRDALSRSGLLHFHADRLTASFPHPTFREFHLARSWLSRDFMEVLETHWTDVRCEEVLALVIALHWQAGRGDMAQSTLRQFTERWRERHGRDPAELWRLRRSPYVVAMALLARAGVDLADPLLGATDRQLVLWTNLENRELPAGAFRVLARHPKTKRAVASNNAAPPDVLATLARDVFADVRQRVAENRATPAELLAQMARTDRKPQVLSSVAGNRMTPPEVLAQLAKCDVEYVRRAVAHNEAAPAEMLSFLSDDTEVSVLRGVAGNTSTPAEVLARLASHGDERVREKVTHSQAALIEIFARSAEDNDPTVLVPEASTVGTTANMRARLAAASVYAREQIARSETTPPKVLALLAEDSDPSVRSGVAGNGATPSYVLEVLAIICPDARRELARRETTPPDMLERFARDGDEFVRMSVAGNRAAPPHILAGLANDSDAWVRSSVVRNQATPPHARKTLVEKSDAAARERLARSKITPPEVLALLADDDDGRVRLWVAHNRATPPEALAGLVEDKEDMVRDVASANPETLPEDLWVK
jgi:hypothetical protein